MKHTTDHSKRQAQNIRGNHTCNPVDGPGTLERALLASNTRPVRQGSSTGFSFVPDADGDKNARSFLTSLQTEQLPRFKPRADSERAKMDLCCATYWVHCHVDGCGAVVVAPRRCESKWCAECFQAWAATAEGEITGHVRTFDWPAHLVLTIRDRPPGELADMIDCLQSSFTKLKQRKVWRAVDSYVRSIGLTVDQHGWWHAHFHLALNVRWMTGVYEAWKEVTRGEGEHAHLGRWQSSPGDLARELVKGTKGDMQGLAEAFRRVPDLFGEAVEAMRGRRWYQAGGEAYGKRIPFQDKPQAVCPGCGEIYVKADWTCVNVSPGAGEKLIAAGAFTSFAFDKMDVQKWSRGA